MGQRTLARPLAWLFVGLVAYASLYPFTGWRTQGGDFLGFLWAPWPRYWTTFDVFSNLVGYVPLGFLLVVSVLRTQGGRWRLIGAFAFPSLLSLTMESLQVYLPSRVPSNVDWLLNSVGGGLGSLLAVLMHRAGLLNRWQRLRANWFVPDAHGALVLLALWPVALLYPAAVPLGLGQVLGKAEVWLAATFADTRFAHWMPTPERVWVPLSPAMEAICVTLSLLVPCLLGYAVLKGPVRRVVHLAVLTLAGLLVSALSSAMTYGPLHAWVWLTPTVLVGGLMGMVAGAGAVALSRRACAVWMLLSLLVALALLNHAPPTPYLAESLDVWAQGRFIRFHGLTQWLGWLWPYAVLWHGVGQATARSTPGGFDQTTQA
ncbi:MAG: VanZ family protein [Burkholderiales bacterium]|nr:VanZ family protein [Burkholderiales bacterium]